jgi:hypothetical protein
MYLLFVIIAGQSFLFSMHETATLCNDRAEMFQEFIINGNPENTAKIECRLEKLEKPVYEMNL